MGDAVIAALWFDRVAGGGMVVGALVYAWRRLRSEAYDRGRYRRSRPVSDRRLREIDVVDVDEFGKGQ